MNIGCFLEREGEKLESFADTKRSRAQAYSSLIIAIVLFPIIGIAWIYVVCVLLIYRTGINALADTISEDEALGLYPCRYIMNITKKAYKICKWGTMISCFWTTREFKKYARRSAFLVIYGFYAKAYERRLYTKRDIH